jgi:hypothetical protein
MKKTIILFLTGLGYLNFFGSAVINAQSEQESVISYRTFSSYSNPPENGFVPQPITTAEALSEIEATFSKTGFYAVYFSKSDINELLNTEGSVGVRFYNAVEDPEMNAVEIVATSIKADGSEIENTYLISKPVLGGYSTKSINKNEARSYVENAVSRSEIIAFNVFFSKYDLNNILINQMSSGIKFSPGDRLFLERDNTTTKTRYTMMAIGVDNDLVEIGDTYMQSIEPCPTLCPDDQLMLTPPSY